MREVNPEETSRALSYQYYIDAPMPMVTVFKSLDVTRIVHLCKKGYKFNMLMCYCIGLSASQIPEFKLLPVGKKMIEYDSIGVDVIVANKKGEINSCDIPFVSDLEEFNKSYLQLTKRVYEKCENYEIGDRMIVGTSSLIKYDIDGVVNMYSGVFNNPFVIWGKYKRKGLKKILKLSFQFHHVQMDGEQACQFLENIQSCICERLSYESRS
ncbi:MAG: CatA-like O-acetyltransferase, family 2 [Clostridiales bacterium]|jgi:chloramphenicol O-acetyltransferase type A|nr:CatA-like O-acetyltransferase, family 2 [Clostridiales bacterium]MCI2161212.1 CatA-like O-acetyltransferase, family 2 [Oscillospiraceae bacterium]MCI1960514.1 CatA-like O-acetyltransferase, family 2 [Clostridiales bacterium]MCI2021001.1 CatA-like O-acetyltransferase, family 2 [Clostridiales bacterium]MCI2025384.1 CatA-like O-acetyltransferase, family 2 [Clostridiales bacterium]